MKNPPSKYIISTVLFLILLAVMAFTVSALIQPVAIVRNNHIETGKVQLEINDGKPVFLSSDLNLAPTESIRKALNLQNKSTVPVYYRIYFETHDGDLDRLLTISLYQDGQEIFTKKASEWTFQSPYTAEQAIEAGETVHYEVKATMATNVTNLGQDLFWKFDIISEGVQVRNNPEKQFE